jgi:hypothetical protein
VNGTDRLFIPGVFDEPIGASPGPCRVRSAFGLLSGDRHWLVLAL